MTPLTPILYAVAPISLSLEPVSGQAGSGSLLGDWFGLGRSVALVSASAAGSCGLVEWSVVDGLAEVDLPWLG
jgi:hypothetical protein